MEHKLIACRSQPPRWRRTWRWVRRLLYIWRVLTLTRYPRPICVAKHLAPFLPSHAVVPIGSDQSISAVSAAQYGSASILLISWAYIKMLGGDGLADSSKVALLNANYMAHRLKDHYTLRYKNANGRVAHELLIDLADFDKAAGLKVTDFAKRLQVCQQTCPYERSIVSNITARTSVSTLLPAHGRSPLACSSSPPSLRPWRRLTGKLICPMYKTHCLTLDLFIASATP